MCTSVDFTNAMVSCNAISPLRQQHQWHNDVLADVLLHVYRSFTMQLTLTTSCWLGAGQVTQYSWLASAQLSHCVTAATAAHQDRNNHQAWQAVINQSSFTDTQMICTDLEWLCAPCWKVPRCPMCVCCAFDSMHAHWRLLVANASPHLACACTANLG